MEYSTIQQHQPLRVPSSFDKQGRALIVQLDEIFDDIYRRFGRLRVEDLGNKLKNLILIEGDNGAYVSVSATIDGLNTEIQDEFGNYYTKSETATKISTAIETALGDYSTTSQTEQAIAAAVGDCYGKVSGITITASGIDVTGSQYVKLTSGNSVVEITPTKIDMNTSGYVSIMGQGQSIIKLEDVSQETAKTIFQADASGVVQAVTINSSEINVTTLNVTDLNVSGSVIAELNIPNIIVSSSPPSGSGIIWLEPNNSVLEPYSYTQFVNDAATSDWTEVQHWAQWSQTCNMSVNIPVEGVKKIKISGKLYKNGSTAAWDGSLTAVAHVSNGNVSEINLGEVGTFPYQQSLKWDYGFSHEITIPATANPTAITSGEITSITFTFTITRVTDRYANKSYPHAMTLVCTGETGSGSSDECTVHYIA